MDVLGRLAGPLQPFPGYASRMRTRIRILSLSELVGDVSGEKWKSDKSEVGSMHSIDNFDQIFPPPPLFLVPPPPPIVLTDGAAHSYVWRLVYIRDRLLSM